ncbi:hypothetical protein ACRTAL_002353 [Clostridium perfringens]|jgi:hypothetical protein
MYRVSSCSRCGKELGESEICSCNDRGKCLGYTDEECINCGRLRVELFENGDEICEKCKFNQLTEEFEF